MGASGCAAYVGKREYWDAASIAACSCITPALPRSFLVRLNLAPDVRKSSSLWTPKEYGLMKWKWGRLNGG